MQHIVKESAYFLGITSEIKKRQTGEEYTAYTLMIMCDKGADNIALDNNVVSLLPENLKPMTPVIITYAVDATKTYSSGILKAIGIQLTEGLDYSGKAVAKAPEKK